MEMKINLWLAFVTNLPGCRDLCKILYKGCCQCQHIKSCRGQCLRGEAAMLTDLAPP